MKIGDLVEFAYGRVGGQIEGMGIFAGYGNDGKHKVLFHGKTYRVPEQLIKVSPSHERTLQMNRWTIKNKAEDLNPRERPKEPSAPTQDLTNIVY